MKEKAVKLRSGETSGRRNGAGNIIAAKHKARKHNEASSEKGGDGASAVSMAGIASAQR